MRAKEIFEANNHKRPDVKKKQTGFVVNIEEETLDNSDYRRVLFTTQHNQLVVMSIPPGEEIGEESHDGSQFLRIESGQAQIVLNGKSTTGSDGTSIVVPAGTRHNIINTSGTEDLKLYTVYSPPQHEEGTIQHTKPEGAEE